MGVAKTALTRDWLVNQIGFEPASIDFERYTNKYLGLNPDTDITAALISKITELGPYCIIEFSHGNFVISDTVLLKYGGRIKCVGRLGTQFQFEPGIDGKACFSTANGSTEMFQCGISGCTIYSTDTTHTKIGVIAQDTSEFFMDDVFVDRFYGKDSVGLQTKGREFTLITRTHIAADICIQHSKNPNTANQPTPGMPTGWLSVDHFIGRDLYLQPSTAPSADGTIPTTNILIDDGANFTNYRLDHFGFVGGQRGLYNVDTSSTIVSYQMQLINGRREQPTLAGGYDFCIDRQNSNGGLQALFLDGYISNSGQNFLYLRGVDGVTLKDTTREAGASFTDLNIDNCNNLELQNTKFANSSTAYMVMPNMRMTGGHAKHQESEPFPRTCSFQYQPTALMYQQKAISGMNGLKKYGYAGALADGASINLALNGVSSGSGGMAYTAATVDVTATATDGSQFESGRWALGAGANAGGASTNGVMLISGSAKCSKTAGSNLLSISCSAASLNNQVTLTNNLGVDVKFVLDASVI